MFHAEDSVLRFPATNSNKLWKEATGMARYSITPFCFCEISISLADVYLKHAHVMHNPKHVSECMYTCWEFFHLSWWSTPGFNSSYSTYAFLTQSPLPTDEVDSIWFYTGGNGKLWIILLYNNPCLYMKTIITFLWHCSVPQYVQIIFPILSKALRNFKNIVILFFSSKLFLICLEHEVKCPKQNIRATATNPLHKLKSIQGMKSRMTCIENEIISKCRYLLLSQFSQGEGKSFTNGSTASTA